MALEKQCPYCGGLDHDRASRIVASLRELVDHIDECNERDLLACDTDPHPPSVFSVFAERARAALAKAEAAK